MKFIHMLCCCVLLITWGCSNTETNEEETIKFNDIFTDSLIVTGSTLIPAAQLNDPWILRNMDTLLLIANKKGDTVLDVFSTHGQFIKRLLERGKEELGIRMAGNIQPDYAHNEFYVYDLFNHKTLKISIPGMLKDTAYQPVLYASLNTDSAFSRTFDKAYVSGNSFIGESTDPQGRLVIFDKKLQDRQYFLKPPPKVDTSLTDEENVGLYSIGIAFNPEGTKIATATYAAGLLNILNITPNGNGLDSVWSATIFSPIGLQRLMADNGSKIAHTKNSLSGYSDICATEKYIYTIFSGKRFKDHDYTYSKILHVMTWDGKTRHKIILDREISRLSVSLDNTMIYGVSMNAKEEPEIVSFSIKDLLK